MLTNAFNEGYLAKCIAHKLIASNKWIYEDLLLHEEQREIMKPAFILTASQHGILGCSN